MVVYPRKIMLQVDEEMFADIEALANEMSSSKAGVCRWMIGAILDQVKAAESTMERLEAVRNVKTVSAKPKASKTGKATQRANMSRKTARGRRA